MKFTTRNGKVIFLLMDKEDWLNGDLCEKDGLSFCAACEPNEFSPIVYVTSNGSAFHQSKNCEWLLKGIKKAKKRWNKITFEIDKGKTEFCKLDYRL